MDGDETYKTQGDKMEREQVRIDIAKRDIASTRAKLRRAKALHSALRHEGAPLERTGVAKAAADGGPEVWPAVAGRRGAETPPRQTRHAAHVAVPPRRAQRKTPATARLPPLASSPRASSPIPPSLAGASADKKQEAREGGRARAATAAQPKASAAAQPKASAAAQPQPSPLQASQIRASTSDGVREDAAEDAVHGHGSTSTAQGARGQAAARAFARAVDGIGAPHARAVAEVQARQVSLDEGGWPAREMELGVCPLVRARHRRLPLPRRFLLSASWPLPPFLPCLPLCACTRHVACTVGPDCPCWHRLVLGMRRAQSCAACAC